MRKIFCLIISGWFVILNRFIFFFNNIILGSHPCFHGIVFVRNYGEIIIGNNFTGSSGKRYNPIGGDTILRIICRRNGLILIGDNVGISNSTIHIVNGLKIGDNVLIGGGCKIWDTDFHSISSTKRAEGDNEVISRPIEIESNAFIGASTIILKGVVIGKNAVVGAGSVVTKSIPPDEVWAGNPAHKIRDL